MSSAKTSKEANGNQVKPINPLVLEGIDIDKHTGVFTVDWEKLGLLRPLSFDELLCLRIYELYRRSHKGRFPRSEHKHALIRSQGLELGRKEPISHNEIDLLFQGLFPLIDDLEISDEEARETLQGNKRAENEIRFSDAMRRFLADSGGNFSKKEYIASLWHLTNHLNKDRESGIRIVPTTRDVNNAVRVGMIVPGTVALMPTSWACINALGPGIWSEIVKKVLGATKDELNARHAIAHTMDDLVEDYKRWFDETYPEYTEGDPDYEDAYLVYDDLEGFREKGGIGKHRYARVLKEETRKQGRRVTLNDVRRLAGLPEDPLLEKRVPRKHNVKEWDRHSIQYAYRKAWDFSGRDLDPPSVEQLEEWVEEQSKLIDAGEFQVMSARRLGPFEKRNGERVEGEILLNREAAQQAGVPRVMLPRHQTICHHFGHMANLLGVVERNEKRPVIVEDDHRNSRMATEVIKKLKKDNKDNEGNLPDASVIKSTLKRIPACVSTKVLDRPEIVMQMTPGDAPRLALRELAGSR